MANIINVVSAHISSPAIWIPIMMNIVVNLHCDSVRAAALHSMSETPSSLRDGGEKVTW